MMKKICCWFKNWIVIIGVLVASLFYFLHCLLNVFNLEFRQWITYLVIFISSILLIWGIFQLIFKIKKRTIKVILTTLSIIGLLILSPYIIFFAAFSYLPEHIVTRDNTKLVAYVNGFMHTNVKYYDYKNILVRGSRLRLYEDYGSGGFDPIQNSQGIIYNVKSYTWYDNDGNPIK
ncbi:MAG: hypothetical protein LKE53_09120 [Oscillospiraceae bacterium]|nr:hypothetical protein [Oscillospiraceae bacterium]